MREIRECTVAVIGGAGFLGSHLVNHLIKDRKCRVIVLDNLITGRRDFVNPEAIFVWCDITQSEYELKKVFMAYDVEYVFNYAAEPYIPVSFERPLHVFDINARGALMAINAAQDSLVKGFLQISSAEIYGDATQKVKETDPVRPHSTYGSSKVAIDYLVQARFKEAQTPVMALRQFNCVGERETHPYVIPEIIKQLQDSNEIHLGNNSFRDFIYAGDATKLAVELLEKGQFGEVYNLGSEGGMMIYDLAHLIARLMSKKIKIVVDETRKRPWEIWHLQSDNTKIYSVIEGRPKTPIEIALLKTITDYLARGYFFYV